MMTKFIAYTDYNKDGAFGESDLDISWAYLQVKELIAAGTIKVENQKDLIIEVQKQYDLNKSSNIAVPSDKRVYNLPEKLATEEIFKFKMDGTDSVNGNKLVDAHTDKKLKFVGSKRVLDNAGGRKHGFSASTYTELDEGTTNHLQFDDFDFTKNFALSFWFRASEGAKRTRSLVEITQKDSSNKFFKINVFRKNITILLRNGTNKTTVKRKAAPWSADKNIDKNWHHFKLVQTSDRIDVSMNDEEISDGVNFRYDTGPKMGKIKTEGMENSILKIGAGKTAIGVSDVSLV